MPTIRAAPPPLIPPRPSSDARAAFFQQVSAPREVAPRPASEVAPQRPAPRTAAAAAPDPTAPQPYLRPGSIIDIKV